MVLPHERTILCTSTSRSCLLPTARAGYNEIAAAEQLHGFTFEVKFAGSSFAPPPDPPQQNVLNVLFHPNSALLHPCRLLPKLAFSHHSVHGSLAVILVSFVSKLRTNVLHHPEGCVSLRRGILYNNKNTHPLPRHHRIPEPPGHRSSHHR